MERVWRISGSQKRSRTFVPLFTLKVLVPSPVFSDLHLHLNVEDEPFRVQMSFILKRSRPKNVTKILMKIVCYFTSKIDDSLVQIDTQFHDDSMSFIQVLLVSILKHDMDSGQVEVMEFPRHLLRK